MITKQFLESIGYRFLSVLRDGGSSSLMKELSKYNWVRIKLCSTNLNPSSLVKVESWQYFPDVKIEGGLVSERFHTKELFLGKVETEEDFKSLEKRLEI